MHLGFYPVCLVCVSYHVNMLQYAVSYTVTLQAPKVSIQIVSNNNIIDSRYTHFHVIKSSHEINLLTSTITPLYMLPLSKNASKRTSLTRCLALWIWKGSTDLYFLHRLPFLSSGSEFTTQIGCIDS